MNLGSQIKKPLRSATASFLRKSISFTHVRREKNKEADALVNEAIDNLTPM